MNKTYDVLISGYVSLDRIIKIQTPAREGYTSLITNRTNAKINYGGCGTNIAFHLSRLGMNAMPVIRVGSDYEETGFKEFLKKNHICMDAVRQIPEEITSVCYLIQGTEGQHITLFYPGAMSGEYSAPLPDDWFKKAKLAVITVGSRCDNEEFLLRCKKNAVQLIFSMKGDMDAFPKTFLQDLLNYCSIIFTNETERAEIERLFDRPIMEFMASGNARMVVTTYGERGSVCCTRQGEKIQVPIYQSGKPPVDTTGSGDAYVAGFLYAFLNGESVRECAMTGTVLSSFIIEKEGCCSNTPDTQALSQRLAQFAKTIKM